MNGLQLMYVFVRGMQAAARAPQPERSGNPVLAVGLDLRRARRLPVLPELDHL